MSYVYGTGANANYSGRVLVYPDQVPYDTDILRTNQYRQVDVAMLAQTILGLPAAFGGNYVQYASGICTQQSAPNMTVEIGTCAIYSPLAMEAIAYGNLGPLAAPILYKQFLNMVSFSSSVLGTITAPSASNWQYYLIQGSPQEVQVNSVNRPYYNPSNPASPIFIAQDDTEIANILFNPGSLVAGTPSAIASGLPVIPTVSAGYVGMFLILVSYNTTSITNNLISAYPNSFIATPLTQVPRSVQYGLFNSVADTSATPNAIVASINPPITTYGSYLRVSVQVANTNTSASTLNLNGVGAANILLANQTALVGDEMVAGGIYDFIWLGGGNFQLMNPSITKAFLTTVQLTTSGNFTVPAGVFELQVEGSGAGGGGGGAATLTSGGGGASGSKSWTRIEVVPGQVIPFVIGAGGAGGGIGADGVSGGATNFSTFLTAPGGGHGWANSTAGIPGGIGTGLIAESGFPGQSGNSLGSAPSGSGGGPGAGYGILTAGVNAATNSGAGGSGGCNGTIGGNGGDGYINVTY